jgi:hypothetical protein
VIRSGPDKPIELYFQDNIPEGMGVELSPELLDLFLTLFGEELLEKCGDLSEGVDRSPSGERSFASHPAEGNLRKIMACLLSRFLRMPGRVPGPRTALPFWR